MSIFAIGNCTKYNIYLLVSLICYFMMDFLFGLNSSNKKRPTSFFSFKAKIKSHKLLDNFIRLSSIFVGGIILHFMEIHNEKKKKGEMSIEDCEKMKENLLKKNNSSNILNLILIGVFFSLYIILKDFIGMPNAYVGFWTFEIMYICIFSYFIFKSKIYIHKKIAIYIMFGLSVIEFIGFLLPNTKHEDLKGKNELTDKNVFDIIIIKFGTYAIPLLFLANELIHVQRDFCWIKGKYLMDIRSFSPSKIFLTIGCFGFFFIIIFFSIFTYVPCKTFNNIEIDGDSYKDLETNATLPLYKEYCPLKDYDENTKTLYLLYDSMKLISREYSNTDKNNMIEIFLIIPLYFIFHLVNEVSRLMMVRYTDPNNILIYKNIYYLLKRIIVIIINEGDEQYITYAQFFILEIEEVVSIISNMIYIEVLELKFCGFDYELKKNISRRGSMDYGDSEDNLQKQKGFELEMGNRESEGSGGSDGCCDDEDANDSYLKHTDD